MAKAAPAAIGRHHVQFYEDVSALAEQVAAHLHQGLQRGGGALAIARTLTLAQIEGRLRERGHDVAKLRDAGRLLLLDAGEVLDALLVDAMPDRARFAAQIGRATTQLAGNAGAADVHAYGEMVDLLWCRGERGAAVALEMLWNELLAEHPLSLVCGYALRAFEHDVAGFELVCEHHDSVAPTQPGDAATATSSSVLAQLVQRARALETEVSRRMRLERRVLDLFALTAQLAAAGTRDQVARLAIDKAMHAVGASEGALWLVSPGGAHLMLAAGSRAGSTTHAHALAGDGPLARVVRTGEPLFIGAPDQVATRLPHVRREELGRDGPRAFAVLPLDAGDRPFGALVLAFDHDREFSEADRAFKAIFARQCALALARIGQQEQERALREASERAASAERHARGEIELLYELIAAANQLDDVAALYELALQAVERGARADRAAILLFDSAGVMRFVASHGLSETYRRAVDGHSPWRQDETAPRPLAIDDVETDPAWAAYRDVFRAEGIRALAFVPLVHHRRLIGKFMLYRDEARAFTAGDLQLAATIAVHIAQAVVRKQHESELARAYREEREARLLAQEATRAREEILSVVSHDLRSPLGTILMSASSLLRVDATERNHRARTIGERIHRQAQRMARLIEDLVDFAGIQAGQIVLDRKEHRADDIVAATSEIFRLVAQEHGLRFEARTPPDLPPIDCDSERAVQVMSNLLANALKVTPRGGEIQIGAEPVGNEVVFYVRDTGPGIEADELPRLFEHYWRSKQSHYKGAGLGLSIARGLVDAHGGRIWAESEPGSGTTFYFSLATDN